MSIKRISLLIILFFCTNNSYTQELNGKYKVTVFDIWENSTSPDTNIRNDSSSIIKMIKSSFDSISIFFTKETLEIVSPKHKARVRLKYPYETKKTENKNIKIFGGIFKKYDTPHEDKYIFRRIIWYMYGVNNITFYESNKTILFGSQYEYNYKIYLEKVITN